MPNQPIRIINNLKNAIDNLFRRKIPGFFLFLLFRKNDVRCSDVSCVKHIAFLRPGKLGDLLVSTPLFRAIKTELPEVRVTVICSPYNNVLVQHSCDVDVVKVVNFHSVFAMVKLYRWIIRNHIDVVVDLTPGFSRTTTLLSYFLRMANVKTGGMHKGEFSRFFDITTDTQGQHIIDRNRVLLETVLKYRFKSIDFHPVIYSNENQVSIASDFTKKIEKEKFIIGINLSAGQKERQWSCDNYRRLIESIIGHYEKNIMIILFSHGEQRQWVDKFLSNDQIISAQSADILITSEILKFCKVLFTPDTAFLHLASAARVPVVALYCTSGENLIRWRAYGVLSKELVAGESSDVNDISPENAFINLKEMIDLLRE